MKNHLERKHILEHLERVADFEVEYPEDADMELAWEQGLMAGMKYYGECAANFEVEYPQNPYATKGTTMQNTTEQLRAAFHEYDAGLAMQAEKQKELERVPAGEARRLLLADELENMELHRRLAADELLAACREHIQNQPA